MTWNGSGDFQRVHNFSADASAGIKILASRQDAEWANFEAGLENCITRDGQNSPSADLPMGAQRHTNVGAPASTTHYMRVAEFLRSFPIYCAFSGTAEAMSASAQFALTSLTAGVQVLLSCPSVNTTTSVTLGLTGAGTATVVRADGRGPARGQVKGLHRYIYDGANWILTDPSRVVGKLAMTLTTTQSVALNTSMPNGGVLTEIAWHTVRLNESSAWTVSASSVFFTVPGGIRAIDIEAQIPTRHTDNGTFTMNASSFTDTIQRNFTVSASANAIFYIAANDLSVSEGSLISVRVGANVSASTVAAGAYLKITPRD